MTAGRVTIVTGAGRGIGRATALALAARGERVMAVSRTESELESLAKEAGVEYLVETVATPEGCARIIEKTRRVLGPVEILVNNAGGSQPRSDVIWEQAPEVWYETIAVNLHGPYELTRLAAPDMIEHRSGRIVMVGSTAGDRTLFPELSAYSAAKAGLLGLMRGVAQDLGAYGATCNAVVPGYTRVPRHERKVERRAAELGVSVEEAWKERLAQGNYPAGRPLEPEEVAATIAFLTSEQASGINGEAITVSLGSVW
jgi:NAD(P)-dependent dehydrogenase (short-subunit alcohol dehydrogenase family)